jgi:WD40 repeat protein
MNADHRPVLILQPERCVAVCAVAFSPNGNLLATGGLRIGVSSQDIHTRHGLDNPVSLWDVQTGELTQTLSQRVGLIGFAPDRTVLVSSGKMIHQWDVSTGRLEPIITAGQFDSPIALSPDGKILAAACAPGIVALWRVG